MNKLIQISILLSISLFFVSCSKTLFQEVKPHKNLSLLYIYVEDSSSQNDTISDSCYDIYINDKTISSCVEINEYVELNNLKSGNIQIAAIRSDVEKKSINLELKNNEIYFVKVNTLSKEFNGFKILRVNKDTALKEIKKMYLANPKEEESIIQNVIEPKDTQSSSKSDEIEKAYKLKVDGLITEEEYKKLKTEILSK